MSRAVVMVCLVSVGAAAAPIPARLVYDASGTSCPGKDALVAAVTARVGTNPFENAAASTLMVQASPSGSGLVATVVRTKPDGTGTGKRELTSAQADCRELFALIELEVTLAIDPLAKTAPAPAAAPVAAPKATVTKFDAGDGPSDTPVTRMTRGALVAERLRLEEKAPSSGVGFIAGGAGAFVAGTVLTVLSLVNQNNTLGVPQGALTGVGVGVAVLGLGGVAFGVFLRLMNLERIELFGLRVGEIDGQLEALQRTGAVDPGPPQPRPLVPVQSASALR